jgi:aminopeptidase N
MLWQTIVSVLIIGLLALPVAMAGAGEPNDDFSPGGPGLGDSYFPWYGNGGYQVEHYYLNIQYDPATDRLVGRARISATANKNLSRFNLDFVGLNLRSLVVNGEDASWTRVAGRELVITPDRGLGEGRDFEVVARYDGVPKLLTGALGQGGVFPTDDGAVFLGQPEVAATWFPVNDHPRDKASYRIRLTVPAGLEAISNGSLVEKSSSDGWSTWTWSGAGEMASYLATAAIGNFDIRRRITSDGIPILDAVDVKLGHKADRALGLEEDVVRFLSDRFGPYPFESLGGIVEHHKVGFALETQTRPVYDYRIFTLYNDEVEDSFVVHELAHMWWGDSVALYDWRDIWLNEGPATYSEWLWFGKHGLDPPREVFKSLCAEPAASKFWDVKTGNPGRENLFDYEATYLRGAMTLQALRHVVGPADFFSILRSWLKENRAGTGTTSEFIALSEQIAGRSLSGFFDRWLFTAAKPADCKGAAARVSRDYSTPGAPRARHVGL